MLIRVKQQHENGCVPACIAMLTGFSYEESLRIVYPWKKTKKWDHYGVRYEHMLRALKNIGFKYKECDVFPFSKICSNAIIIVEHSAYGPIGQRSHVVVWDYAQQRVLDPYVGKGLKKHLCNNSYEKSCISIIEVY